jgi:hypothetical protein
MPIDPIAILMSHMHHIDGLSSTAAQYQAYLERLRASQSAEGNDRVRKRRKAGEHRDLLDEDETSPEAEGEGSPGGQSDEQETQSPPTSGFGNHYA